MIQGTNLWAFVRWYFLGYVFVMLLYCLMSWLLCYNTKGILGARESRLKENFQLKVNNERLFNKSQINFLELSNNKIRKEI